MLLASSSCVLDRAVISTFSSPINFNKADLSSPLIESAFSILSLSSEIVLSNISTLLFTGLQLLYNEQEGYQPPRKKRVVPVMMRLNPLNITSRLSIVHQTFD